MVAHEDLVPSWLVHGCPLWLSGAIKKSDGDSDASSKGYVLEPFPKQEFKPHGWHDILATLDVCGDVQETRHCEKNGYDLTSMNMVSFVLMEEVDEPILRTLQSTG